MEDIVPGLVEAIKAEFASAYEKNAEIQELLELVREGKATYQQAQRYAIEVSKLIGEAYRKHVSSATLPDGRMYYNIASRLIPAALDENYRLVADYTKRVQEDLNQKAGLGLEAKAAPKNQDRVDGLVEVATNAEQYDQVEEQLLQKFENFSQNIVDESLKANVDFQGRAGLKPVIRRRLSGGGCKWCRGLVGEYVYPDVPKDVYRRHENCRCSVTYEPGDGRKQNVHSKRWS